MFDEFKNVFDTMKSFIEWARSVPEYLSGIFPVYIVYAFGTFFLVLTALLVIKLVKGLASLVSGIVSGFIA